jgi:hypothetical protein
MSLAGAIIRSENILESEKTKAWNLVQKIMEHGCRYSDDRDLRQIFRVKQLSFTHAIYLSAIHHAVQSGVGSRGSSITLAPTGERIHPLLQEEWKIVLENRTFRSKLLETEVKPDGAVINEWVDCRPVPETDLWFETAWADFRAGKIYHQL